MDEMRSAWPMSGSESGFTSSLASPRAPALTLAVLARPALVDDPVQELSQRLKGAVGAVVEFDVTAGSGSEQATTLRSSHHLCHNSDQLLEAVDDLPDFVSSDDTARVDD